MSIVFKEFGVRLNFRPTIAGDLIRLHVRPEVSSLDFNNGILLEGFRIPALTTRRAETEVELRDGQSFAIAGLIDNESQDDIGGDPDPQPAADHRQPVQEQGGAQGAHGTAGARHAAAGAAAEPGRGAAAADAAGAVPAAGRRHRRSSLQGGGGVVDAPAMPAGRHDVGAAVTSQERGDSHAKHTVAVRTRRDPDPGRASPSWC